MKTITKMLFNGLSNITVFAIFSVGLANAQNTLQFTSVNATSENAIQLHWASNTNEVYEIDYADQLAGNDDGSTAWNILYDDYPSHGTNTFIADSGNYNNTPTIPHPKLSPMRFYRVMLVQANDSPSNPSVSIVTPTNGASVSGDVTIQVSASSDEILSDVKLFVDGEEQWASSDGTNFIINTCEWANGQHTLFATAKSQSGFEGVANGGVITYGRSVSSYVNLNYDNLISQINLSEPYFEPALGQTQNVTAYFTLNSDWTLTIQDKYNNSVRTVTGSGNYLNFAWDGTGSGETNIPDGIYTYQITAQANGQPNQQLVSSGSADSGGGFISPMLSRANSVSDIDSATQLYITTPDGSGGVLPLAIYPPGFDTNGLIVFEATPLEVKSLVAPPNTALRSTSMANMALLSNDATPNAGSSAPSNQSTTAPKRKPRVGVKGEVGTFGICYKTYGTNGFSSQHPLTGWPYPLQTKVAIDGQTPTATTVDYRILSNKQMADGFSQVMQKGAWKPAFVKADNQWGANDIKKTSLGGNSIFNTCNFGLLMTHGSYANNNTQGNSSDFIRHTYCWLGGNDYVKLADMDFGSDGTNGLRWMTITACNILKTENYNNMNNHGVIPVNNSLHLLLGFSTVGYSNTRLGRYYAENLVDTNDITVISSFENACSKSYDENPRGITNSVRIAISGWNSCWDDSLTTYNDPDLNGLQYEERTVFLLQ